MRSYVVALALAATAAPSLAEAQITSSRKSTAVGALLGGAAGVVTGLVIANATHYALSEGGFVAVFVLGGGVGAVVGARVAASADNDWAEGPGRFHLTMEIGPLASASDDDASASLAQGGFDASREHSPAVAVTRLTTRIIGASKWAWSSRAPGSHSGGGGTQWRPLESK